MSDFILLIKVFPRWKKRQRSGGPREPSWSGAIHRFPLRSFYAGGIGALTLLATVGFELQAGKLELPGWKLVFFTIVFVLGVSQLSVALINWLCNVLLKPRLMPRLDYSSGIPPDRRTLVVVPTLLTATEGIDHLIETLEIRYLANRDDAPSFRFVD